MVSKAQIYNQPQFMDTQHAYTPATEAKTAYLQTLEDGHRASLYALLSSLLVKPPTSEVLSDVGKLNGGGKEIGEAVETLSFLAKKISVSAIEKEYNNLFIGVGRGELLPYGSFYMTGFLNEKPLANLRDEMKRIGIAKAAGASDPEDHIASLCEMMSGVITNQFHISLTIKEQSDFFFFFLGPWAKHFFSDLEGADGSVFYASVGKLGRAFMEVEMESFKFV